MTTTPRDRQHNAPREGGTSSGRPGHDEQPLVSPRNRPAPGRRLLGVALLAMLGSSSPALPDELMNLDITIKDHRFAPSEIHVPAGKPTVLTIKNDDATPEEFDSSALKVEKVIASGRSAKVQLRPLGVGRYPFMGEYHADTAQGVVIAE
jgi:hypothetical protein